MVSVTADKVVVELMAKTAKYKADMQGAKTTTQKAMADVERATTRAVRKQEMEVKRAAASIKREQSQIGMSLKAMAATLATGFGAAKIIELTDNFTRLQNELRVAGLEGENLARVQGQLLALSGKYGVSINELANLYGKSSQAASDLGASEAQLLQLTEASAQALKITGTSAATAQGALLGLTQALAAGTVRAEEFNQINEGGLRPLLQVAANTDKYGGSVARLRQAVVDGKVSSQEFYQAILAGSQELESKASKATLTTSAAFESLNNALIVYFGEADKASGASAALASAIGLVADNLNILIPAVAVLSVGLGVGLVGSLAKTAIAARGAGGALLAAFGGPVGIAITAVITALGYLAVQSGETAIEMDGVSKRAAEMKARLDNAESGLTDSGDAANQARPFIWKIGDAYKYAGDQAQYLAMMAKKAALEQLQADRLKTQGRLANLNRGVATANRSNANPLIAAANAVFGESAEVQQLRQAQKDAQQTEKELTRLINRAVNTKADAFVDAPAAPPTSAPAATGGVGGRTRAGGSAASPNIDPERIMSDIGRELGQAITDALRRADTQTRNRFDTATAGNQNEQDLTRASMELATNRKERNALEVRLLELQHSQERAENELILSTLSSTETERAIAAARLAILDKLQAQDAALLARDQQGPLQQYMQRSQEELENWEDTVGEIGVQGIEAFSSGIADAIVNAKSLQDVFKNVAKSIIADLIQIGIRMVVLQGLKAIGISGASSGGSFQVPGFADGGGMRVKGRGGTDKNVLSLNGQPMARVSMGETVSVTPSGRGQSGGGSAPIYVDARGAVMNDQFAQMILSQARQGSRQDSMNAYRQSVADSPNAVAARNRYG